MATTTDTRHINAKALETWKKGAAEAKDHSMQKFYKPHVFPAFEAIKEALRQEGEKVKVCQNIPAALVLGASYNPQLNLLTYVIGVEPDGSVYACWLYLDFHCDSLNYLRRSASVQLASVAKNVTKDDIILHFSTIYDRVRCLIRP